MALAYDNSASASLSSGASSITSASWAIAGSDRILIASAYSGAGTPAQATGMKWGGSGGVALTEIGTGVTANTYFTGSAWKLIAPAAASQTLYGSWGSTQDELAIGGISLTGADQTTGVRTGGSASAAAQAWSPTATVNVTTVADDVVVDSVSGNSTGNSYLTIAVGAGQTSRQEIDLVSATNWGWGMSTEVATGTSVTMSWTINGVGGADAGWIIKAVPVIPAGAAAPSEAFLTMPPMIPGGWNTGRW